MDLPFILATISIILVTIGLVYTMRNSLPPKEKTNR